MTNRWYKWQLNQTSIVNGRTLGARFEVTGSVQRKESDRSPATTAEEDSRILDAARAKPITIAQEISGLIFYCPISLIIYVTEAFSRRRRR